MPAHGCRKILRRARSFRPVNSVNGKVGAPAGRHVTATFEPAEMRGRLLDAGPHLVLAATTSARMKPASTPRARSSDAVLARLSWARRRTRLAPSVANATAVARANSCLAPGDQSTGAGQSRLHGQYWIGVRRGTGRGSKPRARRDQLALLDRRRQRGCDR